MLRTKAACPVHSVEMLQQGEEHKIEYAKHIFVYYIWTRMEQDTKKGASA